MVLVEKWEVNPTVFNEIQTGNDVRSDPEEFETNVVPYFLVWYVEHLIESLVDGEFWEIFDEIDQSSLSAQIKHHMIKLILIHGLIRHLLSYPNEQC